LSGRGGDLVIQTELHRRHWWVIIPITRPDGDDLPMVLDTGVFLSGISESTREELSRRGLLETVDARRFRLRGLTVQGQPIPDLMVRVSPRVTEVGAAGVLGLDFLGQFTDVHFHVPTMRLTLTRG